MTVESDQTRDLLAQARDRARKLVDTLSAQRRELAGSALEPGHRDAGCAACDEALAAARRTLEHLQAALDDPAR